MNLLVGGGDVLFNVICLKTLLQFTKIILFLNQIVQLRNIYMFKFKRYN